MEFRWTMMTPDELDAAIEHLPLAIVPAGSLEWHGPHLSTGTDFLRGDAICMGLAERLGGGVVLPPTWVAAPGFCNWRGTISFTPALVREVALELYRELEKCGFRQIVVYLSHAGSMQEESWGGAARLYREIGSADIYVTRGLARPTATAMGGGHAGPEETAQLLVAEPAAVHLDRYDPEDTLLPKYTHADGSQLDAKLYSRGLSDEAQAAVEKFMAREHYTWSADLVEKVTPESAQAHMNEICDLLADEVRAWMAGESQG
jgi:creatinine amidohydrolase